MVSRIHSLRLVPIVNGLVLLACIGLISSTQANDAKKPNVIVILADDLGWTDLGCYGSDLHETPHLDGLAKSGMRFTQNYSACTVCSPTRAALLTGKYPARLHITDWIPGAMPENPKLLVPDWQKHLPLEELTLAEVFQGAGYRTASIGKWHLGTEEFYPTHHGFDLNIAGSDKPQPPTYFAPWKIPTLEEGPDGSYLTDRLADEAVRFIEANRDEPFFLYLPHFAVHTPIQGRADLVEKYKGKVRDTLRHKNPHYAAMVESLDQAVGKVLIKLEELQLDKNTIVVFTSDNGGLITRGTTTNQPLRYGKASAYEGGVRVPLIVRWPGQTKSASICDAPIITMDLFPTLVACAGLAVPSNAGSSAAGPGCDGISIVPLLNGSQTLTDRTELFWHYPHHQHYQLGGATPYSAIRSGDHKLIEFHNDGHVELYHVRDDIGESKDLAKQQPELASQLHRRLQAWRQEVGAQMPLPNPKYDPSKPEHTPPPVRKNSKSAPS
ncbi:MAG: sulfatase [Pirellulales bacterium]